MTSNTPTRLWQLFLDDERLPPDMHGEWHVARTVNEAKDLIRILGVPIYMSLDHDLGASRETGMDFLKWLAYEYDPDFIPVWRIHSQNPCGARNMEAFLSSWYRSRSPTTE